METVSHREMRNNSGELLRGTAAGESYLITNQGIPVARLVPVSAPAPDLRVVKPATKRGGFESLARHAVAENSADALEALRADR